MLSNTRRAVVFWFIVAALLAAAGALYLQPAQAAVGDAFNLNCDYSHSLYDDPIVYPDQPGVSHRHDFFGSELTTANTTTYGEIRGGGTGPTTCTNSHDHAAYWAPSAYLNGSLIEPNNIKAYYVHQINGTIISFPSGLKALAGSGSSIAPQSTNVVYFGCGSGTGISKKNYPPDCTGTGGNLQIHVLFPDCGLPGVKDSADHRSHMAYSDPSTHNCPSGGFTAHYPQLQIRLNYDVIDASGTKLTFDCIASQPACNTTTHQAPAYTVHADFINGWDAAELARLIGTI